MNKKGLFCFLVALGFAGFLAGSAESISEETANFNSAKALCLEIESLDMKRAVLEENTDFLIEEAMKHEILLGNRDPESVKLKANAKLAGFFEKIRGEKTAFPENTGDLELFLNGNSGLIIIEYGNLVFAEYSFTGGILKNNFFYAKLASENSEKLFEIPIGYSEKALVVAG